MASTRYDSGKANPEPLGQPLQFASSGKTAKNRFLKGPMAENLASWSPTVPSERGVPSDAHVELYRRWGQGLNSWGVIVTGNIGIAFDGTSGLADAVITPDCAPEGERFEKFKQIASAAKADGSLIVGQVVHSGRQVDGRLNKDPVSASDVQLIGGFGNHPKPHAASHDEIAQLVEGWAYAAEYLEKAGFDGIELHAAHGYLISQFLSRTTNKRTDEYGVQTVENRLRFISDIVRAIKARVQPGFIVAAKLNSVEFQEGGVTAEEAEQVCRQLEALGLDFVELSGGTYEALGTSWEKESTRQREAFFGEWAATVVKAMGPERKMKVYISGGLRTVGKMVEALDTFDGVALARSSAAEPNLSSLILEGQVLGAKKAADGFENDTMKELFTAGTQISQIARGMEPMDHSDPEIMATYGGDLGAHFQKMAADGDKMELVGAVQYTGPLIAHKA